MFWRWKYKKYTNHRYHVAQYGKCINAATLKNKNTSKWQCPRTCSAITLSGHLCPQMLEDHTFWHSVSISQMLIVNSTNRRLHTKGDDKGWRHEKLNSQIKRNSIPGRKDNEAPIFKTFWSGTFSILLHNLHLFVCVPWHSCERQRIITAAGSLLPRHGC